MNVIFLTRFDFTYSKKDGGLLGAYRNYILLEKIYGKENIQLCIITSHQNGERDHIKYFYTPDNIFHNYLTYFHLKDRISGRLEKEIVDYINSHPADVIFFDGSTFGQMADKIKSIRYKIVYFHNIERQYAWEQVKKRSPLCIFRYWATVFNEKKMVGMTNNLICVNSRDAKLLKEYYGKKSNFILPATFSDNYKKNKAMEDGVEISNEIKLLFVGSYFAHNYKGLLWFIENVLPDINCRLIVIGNNMDRLRKKLNESAGRKVDIKGTVEELSEYYEEADAVVMPVFMGGGIKVKTAEALMYGKTIFASEEALQGYDIDGIKNIYQCNTKEEFVKNITEYSMKGNRRKFNQEIRQLFLDKYCTENYVERFRWYLKSINML